MKNSSPEPRQEANQTVRLQIDTKDGDPSIRISSTDQRLHLNPVRAQLLQREERLLGYPWSSLLWYLAVPKQRPAWMRVDRLLGEPGIGRDTETGRAELERRMETRRMEETDPATLTALRRGWRQGSAEFKRELLEKMEAGMGENHSGQLRLEVAEANVERVK